MLLLRTDFQRNGEHANSKKIHANLPTNAMAPGPMDETTLPSTVTDADLTRCTTNLIANEERGKIIMEQRKNKMITDLF